MDEEVVLLEEQLAAAHADIEQLQSRIAEAEAAVTTHTGELDGLRRLLAERDARLGEQTRQLGGARDALTAAQSQARQAVSRLREAVLAREPDLPGDIVMGETVVELDEALGRARQTVARVREHLEQQAQSLRVPAGAPVRSAPDTSSLSPAEKIRLGLAKS